MLLLLLNIDVDTNDSQLCSICRRLTAESWEREKSHDQLMLMFWKHLICLFVFCPAFNFEPTESLCTVLVSNYISLDEVFILHLYWFIWLMNSNRIFHVCPGYSIMVTRSPEAETGRFITKPVHRPGIIIFYWFRNKWGCAIRYDSTQSNRPVGPNLLSKFLHNQSELELSSLRVHNSL